LPAISGLRGSLFVFIADMTLVFSLLAMLAADPAAPVRIGYGEARPYCYTLPDGRPAGFQIDVFNEAARRDGLRLEWTRARSNEENTRALAEGRLDMLPMAVAYEERRKLLYISEPWWKEDTILLVRGEAENGAPGTPGRIAFPQILLPGAGARYTRSRLIVTNSGPQALEHLCRNSADATLLGATYIRELVNARPKVCEAVPLRIYDSPVTADFSIIANPDRREAADRLRLRITEMTADGTIARIASRHPPISTPYATRMAEELHEQYQRRRLWALLLSALAILTAGVVILVRQILSRRKLQSILEQQLRTEQELRDSQAILRQRSLDLVRSNEDLQAFAYSVSHDLQEPVRTQALYTELLERKFRHVLPSEANEFLAVIRRNALRTQEMMKSVLQYSRVGQAERPKSLVDCSGLLSEVLQELRSPLEQAQARVTTGLLPRVWGWQDRLHQVFQNLIENAIKYRKPDVPPEIAVSAAHTGNEWEFSISDNGIGFSQEYADKVFGLFKRLHGHERYGGSGVGLAVCKRVVERHGGRIWAESREGEGSTFYFTLPIDVEDSDTVSMPAEAMADRQ
jgi:signal transduction histidine kinase